MSALREQWRLGAALAVLFASAAALTARSLAATHGQLIYPLDDTYIQMAIARNLATHGVWGVTPYEFSGAGTSLLWPLLLAAVYRIAGRHDAAPLALNLIFAALTVVLAQRVLKRAGAGRHSQLAMLLLLIFGVSLPAVSLLGMEHTLQCAAALALAWTSARLCSEDDPQERARWMRRTCAAAALAVAARYDTGAVLVGALVIVTATRGWRSAATIAACGLAPAAAYALAAGWHGWPPLPASVLIKQVNLGRLAAVRQLVHTPELLTLSLCALALLAALAAADRRERPTREAREAMMMLGVFLIATFVQLQFVVASERYDAYLVALGIVFVGAAAARWHSALALSSAAVAAAVLLTAGAALLRGGRMWHQTLDDVRGVYAHEIQLGRFLRQHPQPGALMLNDLGAASYASDVHLVDLDGLASIDVTRAIRQGGLDAAAIRGLARAHDVRTAVLNDFSADVPREWTCVATWTDPGAARPFYFFLAVDAAAAAALQADVRAFQASASPAHALRFGGCALSP
jgi:hypothetical protein